MWGTVKEIVTTISAIIALLVTVITPLIWLIRKYNNNLNHIFVLIKEQGEINKQQAAEIYENRNELKKHGEELEKINKCLEANRQEHEDIGINLDGLRQGLLVIIQIELDKLLCHCINRGSRSLKESERADALYQAYVALKGNHGMDRKKADFDKLLIKDFVGDKAPTRAI